VKSSLLLITTLLLSWSLSSQKIFSTDKSFQSDIKVFIVNQSYQADLKVFKVSWEYEIKRNQGLWFFVDQEYKSEKNIYFVDYLYQAVWKNSAKKHLLY
jgi:hypothetical protein